MPASFIDTNVLVYLATGDAAKTDRAAALLNAGDAIISVQVLNELANVARKKLRHSWPQIQEVLATLRAILPVCDMTVEVHAEGLRLAQRYGLSVYDSMIVAAALRAGCEILWSEDMQDGMVIDGRMRVSNPFSETP